MAGLRLKPGLLAGVALALVFGLTPAHAGTTCGSGTASGSNATACGDSSTAEGSYSTAYGYGTYAGGTSSAAFGAGSYANGNGDLALGGATAATFTLGQAQVGHTIRLVVTAHNSDGATAATSAQSAVVKASSAPTGAIKLPNGKTSIPASSVVLPDRLVINGEGFNPRRLTSRAPFQARIHVADTKGNVVRGALVYVLGAPYAWVRQGVEVPTDQNGWATVTITPSARFTRMPQVFQHMKQVDLIQTSSLGCGGCDSYIKPYSERVLLFRITNRSLE